MRLTLKRVLGAAVGLIGTIAYVWIAAVRAVPAVRQQKAAARARRRAG